MSADRSTGLPGILLVSPWFAEPGGVTTVVRQQARYLIEAGYRPILLLPNGEDTRPPAGGPDLEIIGIEIPSPVVAGRPVRSRLGFVKNLPFALVRLMKLFADRDIQVVNIHYPEPHHVVFALLKYLRAFRLVVSPHGTDLLPGGALAGRHPASLRLVLQGADAIVVPSADFGRRLVASMPALRRTITVVPHGIAGRPRSEAVVAPPLPDRFIVCAGALRAVKGQDLMVRAFVDVARAVPDCHLVLVGEGALRADLETLARASNLQDRIHLLGEQDHAATLAVIARAELVVLPSRMESFGVVLLEAMVHGKAVVATRVGGVPEVVRDGETGLLVASEAPAELAKGIVSLLGDPDRRRRMGDAGLRVAHDAFSHERASEAYRRVLLGS